MKTNIFYALLLAGLALSSCNKFLDGDDVPNKIVASEYFTNEASLKTYANGFLNSYTPDVSTLTRGDVNAEYMTKNNPGNFYLGSWDSNQQGGWDASDWNMLYNVNYFLKYMTGAKDSVSEDVYKHYEGVGRFWRAWFYYNKVKTFGAVPWYDEPIDPEDHDQLYKERDNREFVMSKILEDLKYAEENCLTGSGYVNCGQINGYIAAAFKARVCLWEGTYRKYHKVDPSTNSAWTGSYGTADDFLKECVKSCEFIMGSGKYRINPGTKYSNLFLSPSIEYSEILWAREYSAGLNIYHNTTSIFNSSSSGGCWNMTKAFLNTYLHTDGSRHTDKPGYKTMTFREELSGRDNRLSQTVMCPGYQKVQDGNKVEYSVFINTSFMKTGYWICKWMLPSNAYEGNTTCNNALPILRYAEVLLNYAEAKAELGQFSEAEWEKSIAPLRARAGVATIPPVDADKYLVDYFDNSVTDKWILEIRRERGIELYMEGLRYEDLMRWKLGQLITRKWDGMYARLDEKIAIDQAGDKFVCFTQSKAGSDPKTTYFVLDRNPYHSINADNCIQFEQIPLVWEERMYLRPIPQSALNINLDLGQNPGWE
jgi:hypothetical protein